VYWSAGHALTERDLHAGIILQAREIWTKRCSPELDGISVRRLLLKGDPAREIARTAREEEGGPDRDVHAQPCGVLSLFTRLVAAKVLHTCDCPVWTDTHPEDERTQEFAIRRILCAIDLSAHSRHTASRAAQIAAQFDAQLTLVHITAGVQTYGPGGSMSFPNGKRCSSATPLRRSPSFSEMHTPMPR